LTAAGVSAVVVPRAAIEADLGPALPIETELVAAALYVFDGARWHARAEFPFSAPR
jgi:hypothetical protein